MFKNYRSYGFLVLLLLGGCKQPKMPSHSKKHTELPQFFDVRPAGKAVSYLYAPGMMNSEVGMGRYCPNFTASTGEQVQWTSGGHIIGQPHSAVTFPEVDLRKPGYFTLNPITVFINNLRQDLSPLARRFLQDNLGFTVTDNPDSPLSVVNYSFNFSQANIGQKKDIKTFHAAYCDHIKQYPDTQVIMLGDSRGSATIFNYIALHKPTQVKAAILDGVFDSVPHAVKHFAYTDKEPRAEKRLHDCVKFVMGSYREQGISPRECAEIIGDDVPLLLVISLKDGLVFPQCAFYLYNRLRQRGHEKVHLLVLKKAFHPSYMVSDPDDKKAFETTVHAFYKHYNLPYNSQKAAEGAQPFSETQPTREYLQKTYNLHECPYCDPVAPILPVKKKTRRKS